MRIIERVVFITEDGKQHESMWAATQHEQYLELALKLDKEFLFRASDTTAAGDIASWMLRCYKLIPFEHGVDYNEQISEALGWLNLAITMAEDWRGNKMPEEFKEFDAEIEAMRKALTMLAAYAGVEA